MERHPPFDAMKGDDRVNHLQNDEQFNSYIIKLNEWEEQRREGKHMPHRRDDGTRAEAEQSASFTTKQVVGYLWPLALLREHGKDVPKRLQSVSHQGRVVKGAILKEFVVGAIELASEGSRTARRVSTLAHDDSDHSDQAEAVFSGMQRAIQVSTIEGEGGELSLRRARGGDSDDEMAGILWGDSLPASNSKSRAADEDPSQPPKPKVARGKDSNGAPSSTVKRPKHGPQSADPSANNSANPNSWSTLLSNPAPKEKKKGGSDSRELEKGEALILQVQQLRCSLADSEQVQKLTLQKIRSLQEKVELRLREELVVLYQEMVRASGPSSRAAKVWEGLRDAKDMLAVAGDFVEALQDEEAAPATLSLRASKLWEECKIQLPENINFILCHKGAEELLLKKQWETVCQYLDPAFRTQLPNGIASLLPQTFGNSDGSAENASPSPKLDDKLLDFQTGCIVRCVNNLFMRAMPVAEDAERAAQMQTAIQDVQDFLDTVTQSSLAKSLQSAGKTHLLDDLSRLLSLARAAAIAVPAKWTLTRRFSLPPTVTAWSRQRTVSSRAGRLHGTLRLPCFP